MKETLDKIKPLMDAYHEYLFKTKVLVLTPEQRQQVQEIADVVVPGARVDLNCDTCVTNALAIYSSYWERESKKLQEEPPAEETPKPKRKKA